MTKPRSRRDVLTAIDVTLTKVLWENVPSFPSQDSLYDVHVIDSEGRRSHG
ncbi:MAG TPA: hypothetical protein VIY67_05130 [Nitrospiraceae bacterium]